MFIRSKSALGLLLNFHLPLHFPPFPVTRLQSLDYKDTLLNHCFRTFPTEMTVILPVRMVFPSAAESKSRILMLMQKQNAIVFRDMYLR